MAPPARRAGGKTDDSEADAPAERSDAGDATAAREQGSPGPRAQDSNAVNEEFTSEGAPGGEEHPFWVADRALPVGPEMGGEAFPARAFSPGDRVPAEHVKRYGWEPYVSPPPAPETAEES
jgi:hypothetical protein